MPAFKLALDMKSDMIELDVTLSRDNIPFVFHDKTLNRTTDGKGPVQRYLQRELRELDAGLWFGNEFKETRIPTLENVLSWASKSIALNIEIKQEAVNQNHENGIVELVSELVLDQKMANQVVISSFSNEALISSRQISPGIPTAHLVNPWSRGSVRDYRLMMKLGAVGLNIKPRQMKPKLMERAVRDNCPVWVYTVDDEEEMKAVIGKGATGIFTNKPDVLLKVAVNALYRNMK